MNKISVTHGWKINKYVDVDRTNIFLIPPLIAIAGTRSDSIGDLTIKSKCSCLIGSYKERNTSFCAETSKIYNNFLFHIISYSP